MEQLCTFCQRVREEFPEKNIVPGNVVSREVAEELILNGKVDVIKSGIGPDGARTTRVTTEGGMPQLSAV